MTDDDLRARLRHADPAASLPPAAPAHLRSLVEDTMTTATVAARPRYAVPAAAALVLLAAAAAGWLLPRPPQDPSGSGTVVAAPSTPAAVVRLTATGARAKCVEPTSGVLAATADFAFAGTVTGVAGDVVTLRVTRVHRGAAAGTVEVAQQGETSESLMGSGRFEIGEDYLVASSEGTVLICGYSGEAGTPGLTGLYDRAFS